jgi:hypothetical protein
MIWLPIVSGHNLIPYRRDLFHINEHFHSPIDLIPEGRSDDTFFTPRRASGLGLAALIAQHRGFSAAMSGYNAPMTLACDQNCQSPETVSPRPDDY